MKSSIDSDIEYIKKEYDSCKAKGFELLDNGKIDAGLKYLEFAGKIAWKFPILDAFCDDDLEERLESALEHKIEKINLKVQSKKIIFYVSQIVDRGGLTEQYLDYFIENNLEVLFIIPNENSKKRGKQILNKIKKSNNIILYTPLEISYIKKIIAIRKKIQEFKPSISFLHIVPNDIIGTSTFLNIHGVTRYYIVHNDHTFWFGKKCSDFFIEFRWFGQILSINHRSIPKEKIFLNPFYPITEGASFKGFPFNKKEKVIGISGANLYKYLKDPSLKYLHKIKDLIHLHPNFVFCLCGWGNHKPIQDFIRTNALSEKFFFLGHRDDFFELVGNSDLMFESFPMKGGLTPLFAIKQGVPVIGISDITSNSGSLEDLLMLENYKQPSRFKEFINESNRLISSKEERKKLTEIQSKTVLTKENFQKNLSNILQNKGNLNKNHQTKFNYNRIQDLRSIILETSNIKSFIKHLKYQHLISILEIPEKYFLVFQLLLFSKLSFRSRASILFKLFK